MSTGAGPNPDWMLVEVEVATEDLTWVLAEGMLAVDGSGDDLIESCGCFGKLVVIFILKRMSVCRWCGDDIEERLYDWRERRLLYRNVHIGR